MYFMWCMWQESHRGEAACSAVQSSFLQVASDYLHWALSFTKGTLLSKLSLSLVSLYAAKLGKCSKMWFQGPLVFSWVSLVVPAISQWMVLYCWLLVWGWQARLEHWFALTVSPCDLWAHWMWYTDTPLKTSLLVILWREPKLSNCI